MYVSMVNSDCLFTDKHSLQTYTRSTQTHSTHFNVTTIFITQLYAHGHKDTQRWHWKQKHNKNTTTKNTSHQFLISH